ncbi:SPOR domain-containing protein [Dokdonella sp.]|uniref:SPOR domain-containing protein n=1 Tax=Dokdonella sp. TaxID=2291710 RepID=UPI003C67E51E
MKQRLLGAVVLIALAIIFVPMLFSGSGPKQDSATVDLEIPPPPNREFETRVLTVDAVNQDPSRQAAQPAATAEPVTAVDTKVPPRVEAMPETPATAEVKPQPAPAVIPDVPEKPATTAQVEAGKAANGDFLVHLGVYTSSKNAEDLVASLKRSGFPAFSESVDFKGKQAQRVRVGPYADRAEAESARIRIKQLKSDVPGSVVSVAGNAKADAPSSAVPATRAGGWAVQLGAFAAVEDANKLGARLQAAGFAAFVEEVKSDGKTLWRVRAGPEVDRANAETLRGRIKDKLKVDGLVVTQP